MLIRGVELVGGSLGRHDIAIEEGRIAAVTPAGADDAAAKSRGSALGSGAMRGPAFQLERALAFPGLINSHDHLEFNLHRPLGDRRYADYVEWAADIHARFSVEIARVESLPWSLRFRWGALKNLLCGVTTVAHHGAGVSALPGSLSPVNLVVGTAVHSVRLDPHWRRHVLSPTAQAPLVFHLGEGVNDESRREIEAVIRWNLWRRRIVAVHGIAMTEDQAPRFDAVVWCPVSNELLFGATANVAALKRKTRILFGTDSTLTGGWNIWQHLRRAREIGGLDDRELFDAVTTAAARTWGDAGGQLDAGHRADLVVARMKHPGAWDSFYAIDPEDLLLVIGAGRVLVADDTVENVAQLGLPYAIRLGSSIKRVAEDLSPMLKEIQGRGLLANLPLGLA